MARLVFSLYIFKASDSFLKLADVGDFLELAEEGGL